MPRSFRGLQGFEVVAVMLVVAFSPAAARAQFSDPGTAPGSSALSIPQDHLLQPEELNRMLLGSETRPLVLQVGSHVMFSQAHIRGAQYAGPGSQAAGLRLLESKVAGLRKSAPIVIYCGCCPWIRCPNMGPAFHRLADLGFTHVRALYIQNDFGVDWVDKGYSVETGG